MSASSSGRLLANSVPCSSVVSPVDTCWVDGCEPRHVSSYPHRKASTVILGRSLRRPGLRVKFIRAPPFLGPRNRDATVFRVAFHGFIRPDTRLEVSISRNADERGLVDRIRGRNFLRGLRTVEGLKGWGWTLLCLARGFGRVSGIQRN